MRTIMNNRMSEGMGLIGSWLVISICFSIGTLFNYPAYFPYVFIMVALSAGLGFILHELAHRSTARRYGCYAVYQVWPWGIVLSFAMALLTQGQFIFAALGAVYITPMVISPNADRKTVAKIFGHISLAGPLMNLLLAGVFYILAPSGGFVGGIASYGFTINLWLAAFNLIPVPPLDGSKIFAWSKPVWALFAIPTWILVFLL